MRRPIVCLLLLTLICCVSQGKKKKKEVKIEVMEAISECTERAEDGDTLKVHYTGRLESTGEVFDSSQGKQPFEFVIGAKPKQVIEGWDIGLKGMCVGERRLIVIPPEFAYGKRGSPPQIPPHATLEFDTHLVSLTKQTFQEKYLPHVQFLSIPVGIGIFFYYLYDKIRRAPSEQEVKKAGKIEKKKSSKKKK
ncbi:uncharacterized protein [Ptychodera flava]|uniref:uncharacterized protein n=1 Tax=Ptychodera flava TaxID=63121 RepID=UPI003969C334